MTETKIGAVLGAALATIATFALVTVVMPAIVIMMKSMMT